MHVLAPGCTRTAFFALITCLLCASTVLLSAQSKPFTKDDVITLLKGDVPAKRVEVLVRQRGVDFQLTPETESELRQAGASDPLLAVLQDLAPTPPVTVPASPIHAPPASAIKPMLTTDAQFAIPGTSPIGEGLIGNATENVNKALGWLNPLIRNAKDPWAGLLSWQPRNPDNGVIGIHFSVSPSPPSPTVAPQLVMSKSPTSLSMAIPAEHYQDPAAIFADVLELFIWNLPPQSRSAHGRLVEQIKRSAGQFSYPGGPLPPEVLAKLGVGASSQAKSLDPDTPDTGTNAGIYDGDIQGRVIGSTVKCFNFLFSKGVPYLTKLQNTALQKAKESSQAGDAQAAAEWQTVATTLGDDIRTLNSLLEALPRQLKVDFYYRAAEQMTARGRAAKPARIPESEPGVRITIALPKEAYYGQGPAAVKDALIQELGNQAGSMQVRRAVDDFFLLYGGDPANKGDYFAVTMQQLHPQPDEALGTLSKLWSTAPR
jgi:hypothetical protein